MQNLPNDDYIAVLRPNARPMYSRLSCSPTPLAPGDEQEPSSCTRLDLYPRATQLRR